MIGYITVGTNDIGKASAFYDALLGEMGAKRTMDFDVFKVWSIGKGTEFSVTLPFNKEAATVGNGVMVALQADSPEMVDRMHAKALELGASDEGAPGPRGDQGFYAGYFRDPDGNKLNFFHY
ncbi:VOC family protein [Kordiimonas lacus]|uniref:Predicted lactoylglutathione lyase n=1 Tax=Kordiimonas lacus TaxID=637679 RepID=A0A1G7B8D8_9PROT|nr:VOC family protein [Kordiimonas lacus]SDE22576.1 Predicted lactoylglutathione lyase [Kordiimonas lacus]